MSWSRVGSISAPSMLRSIIGPDNDPTFGIQFGAISDREISFSLQKDIDATAHAYVCTYIYMATYIYIYMNECACCI